MKTQIQIQAKINLLLEEKKLAAIKMNQATSVGLKALIQNENYARTVSLNLLDWVLK